MYRVLIADDSQPIRLLLRVWLQVTDEFAVVGEAEDGRQAVRLAADLLPDVVLLDLSMPDLDGLEALPLIHRAAPGVQVVVVTAFDAARGRPAAMSAGAAAYFDKGTIDPDFGTHLLAVLR